LLCFCAPFELGIAGREPRKQPGARVRNPSISAVSLRRAPKRKGKGNPPRRHSRLLIDRHHNHLFQLRPGFKKVEQFRDSNARADSDGGLPRAISKPSIFFQHFENRGDNLAPVRRTGFDKQSFVLRLNDLSHRVSAFATAFGPAAGAQANPLVGRAIQFERALSSQLPLRNQIQRSVLSVGAAELHFHEHAVAAADDPPFLSAVGQNCRKMRG
jgi:hypothetical protein